MQEEDGRIKAVGKMGHEAFVSWLEKKLKEGWETPEYRWSAMLNPPEKAIKTKAVKAKKA